MDKERHKAICSNCGNECEVPFKPNGDRPIKCNDCFRKNKPWRDFNNKRRDFDVTCAECGKATTVPFKPTQGKPVLCRGCFRK
ncbi:MAG: zinc-binding protein [Candidatus Peregrinibacteria bacterium]|nr:zinc-binding protein [Candidatus Peregrinibacteria bacterium]